MNSYPSTGDALERMLTDMREDIKELKRRNSELSRKIIDLEIRVTACGCP